VGASHAEGSASRTARADSSGGRDASAGRGLDRIVPFGTALRFSHRWDGMALLEVLTRGVVLDAMG
jgi:hypothetical protein